MLLGDVVDELLDEHRLADAGAAEEADLAAADVRGEQVDDLDAGLEDLDLGTSSSNAGGSRWIGQRSVPSGGAGLPSTGSPMTFKMRPRSSAPTGTEIGAPVSRRVHPADEAVGRVHRDRADAVVAEVLLHLRDQIVGRLRRSIRSAE